MPADTPKVGLLVTCLVDLFRPSVGFAAVKLLEDAGCRVEAPRAQTCCGQPAYNSGDRKDAQALSFVRRQAKKLEKWGVFVWVDRGSLMACEIADYDPKSFEGNEVDVTAPESQNFLDDVNKALGTYFKLDQFAGR